MNNYYNNNNMMNNENNDYDYYDYYNSISIILPAFLHQTGDLEAPNSIAPLSPRSSEAQKRSQSALMADPKWEKMLSAAKLVTFAKGEKVLTHGNYANALIQVRRG